MHHVENSKQVLTSLGLAGHYMTHKQGSHTPLRDARRACHQEYEHDRGPNASVGSWHAHHISEGEIDNCNGKVLEGLPPVLELPGPEGGGCTWREGGWRREVTRLPVGGHALFDQGKQARFYSSRLCDGSNAWLTRLDFQRFPTAWTLSGLHALPDLGIEAEG